MVKSVEPPKNGGFQKKKNVSRFLACWSLKRIIPCFARFWRSLLTGSNPWKILVPKLPRGRHRWTSGSHQSRCRRYPSNLSSTHWYLADGPMWNPQGVPPFFPNMFVKWMMNQVDDGCQILFHRKCLEITISIHDFQPFCFFEDLVHIAELIWWSSWWNSWIHNMYKSHGFQFSRSNRISVKDSEAKATQRFEGGTHSISHRTNDIRAHLESTIGRAIYQLLHPLLFGKKPWEIRGFFYTELWTFHSPRCCWKKNLVEIQLTWYFGKSVYQKKEDSGPSPWTPRRAWGHSAVLGRGKHPACTTRLLEWPWNVDHQINKKRRKNAKSCSHEHSNRHHNIERVMNYTTLAKWKNPPSKPSKWSKLRYGPEVELQR